MKEKGSLEYIFSGLILIVIGLIFSLRSARIIGYDEWWAYLLLGLGIVFFIDALLRAVIIKKVSVGRIIAGAILWTIGVGKLVSLRGWFFYLILIIGLVLLILGIINLVKKGS